MDPADRLLFSEFKPNVLDSAVCRNPAKWKERNQRRRQSRKSSRKPQGGDRQEASAPTWEVQRFEPEGANDCKDDDLKKPEVVRQERCWHSSAVRAETPVEVEQEPRQGPRKPQGTVMPGGYYVRSFEEMHEQTMRAFNVRLTKPFKRPPREVDDEEEIPPLEPEEPAEAKGTGVQSKATQEVLRRLKARGQDEEKARRTEEEVERRKEAEERRQRRQVEVKIKKLQEEEEAKAELRREAEERRRQVEEAVAQAQSRRKADPEGAAAAKAQRLDEERRVALAAAQQERELRRQRRAQKDAEEDARLKEERRVRREQEEEAARKERAEATRRKREEKRRRQEQARKDREEAELLERLHAEEEAARRRQEAARRQAMEDASRETQAKVASEVTPPPVSEEELQRQQEERRKQAEQRRKEAKEKAERAKKAAAAGASPASMADAGAEGQKPGAQAPSVHVNVAVLGHQSSGKSMLTGAILLATGALSERDLAKRRKECERLPVEELQREEGARTSGGAQLMLLDVPGGRKSLPQAVQAAAEADIALLVVSAKGRELEGALREGSGGSSVLQEQLRVVSGLGAWRLVVAVTKMDEVSWRQDRFDEVTLALKPLLARTGFQDSVSFAPVDGLAAELDCKKAPWHSASLLSCLDEAACSFEARQGPSRVLIFESVKESGAAKAGTLRIRGRIEQGKVVRGQRCILAPGQLPCVVEAMQRAFCASSGSRAPQTLTEAKSGDAVELQLSGGPFPDLPNSGGPATASWCGALLAEAEAPVRAADRIKASMDILEMPRPLTVGFKCVLHVHAATVEAEVEKIQDATDLATGIKTEKPKMVKAGQRLTLLLKLSREVPVCEGGDTSGGRLSLLMLRSEETTLATGHVLEVPREK
eukprot:TRINITY_DN40822_c0_g1_i1.p1 TRINITY_DN40822_c0_g1~~TRINITY_DN40822_c0_g1_i1.p1  ORF type:complete len:883 (-),score=271.25 TRINITY_DN40822_c0_g1_i1:4-2652(-)